MDIEIIQKKILCDRMLQNTYKKIGFNEMVVEQYVPDIKEQWNSNAKVFRVDSVSFLFLWGDILTWGCLFLVAIILAAVSYSSLPAQMPVQWSDGVATSFANKGFIFAYPVAFVIIRFILRPYVANWIRKNMMYSDWITDYAVNFLCFIALTVESYTILTNMGIMGNIAIYIVTDVLVFIFAFIIGWKKSTKISAPSH